MENYEIKGLSVKIAVVHSFYNQDAPSGENSAVNSQVQSLRRAGHEVKLISLQTNSGRQTGAYKVRAAFRVAFGWGRNPLSEIRRFRPDVVHVHNLFPNFSTKWLGAIKVPVVASIHNYRYLCAAGTFFVENKQCFACIDAGGSKPSLKKKCYRGSLAATAPLALANRKLGISSALAQHASKILVLTQEAQNIFLRAGWSSEKLHVVPNFVEASGISKATHEKEDFARDSWIYVGRLSTEKGVLELLNDWPEGEKLSIVGDGPLLSTVERTVESLTNVEVLGRLSREDILKRLSAAKGMIFPSLWLEGLPLVFLEAMSVGCPTVARTSNVVARLVSEFNVGEVYSNGTQLSSALKAVESRFSEMNLRSVEVFNSEFTEQAWISRMNQIYESSTK